MGVWMEWNGKRWISEEFGVTACFDARCLVCTLSLRFYCALLLLVEEGVVAIVNAKTFAYPLSLSHLVFSTIIVVRRCGHDFGVVPSHLLFAAG